MEYRQLGGSGLMVPALSLGTGTFGGKGEFFKSWGATDVAEATKLVDICLDAGLNMFDSADIYSKGAAEEILGQAIKGRRHQVLISTKGTFRSGPGPNDVGSSRFHITQAVDGSLRRLGTDYIDLYYQHYPDRSTPIEETLEAMSDLVSQGKVRYIASSNVTGWQIADADHLARERGLQRFTGCQIEWSLLNRAVETDIVPACRHFDVGVVPYFPLASGMLTGKHTRGKVAPGSRMEAPYFASVLTDENWDKVERLTAVAEARGHTILELAVCWLLSQDGVSSVLTGATKPEQVTANVEASTWRLGNDDLAAVAEALAGTG